MMSMGLLPVSVQGQWGIALGQRSRVDAKGFRATSRPFDWRRRSWLHLGDSVTMGVGVAADSTFSGRLAGVQDSVNVLNVSWLGYTTEDYKHVVETLIGESVPEVLISRLTVFHCLNDIDSQQHARPGSGYRSWLGPVEPLLKEHSRLYVLAKTILTLMRQKITPLGRV
jgi:hypothetical protein